MQVVPLFVVLANKDGLESEHSLVSSREAARVLNARTVFLQADRWVHQLEPESSAVFFLATHGGYAEDGTLQSHLESRGLRHTHSPAAAARIMSNKHETKLRYLELNIPTPPWSWGGKAFGNIAGLSRWISKPICGGSKHGLALESAPSSDPSFLSEDYVAGEYEISVWLLGSSNLTVFPPLWRRRSLGQLGKLLDLDASPPMLLAGPCIEMARRFHGSVGAHGLTKTDFVVDEDDRCWAIETDVHPALGKNHGGARQAQKANFTYDEFIIAIAKDHV